MTNNTRFLIGFTGPKHVGKSTAAKMLSNIHPSHRLNFKDALIAELKTCYKDLLYELSLIYDGPDGDFDWLFEHKPPAVRALMKNHGTDFRRGKNKKHWVVEWSINYANNYYPDSVIVDDVRFINEAEELRKYGGVIIRLERDDVKTTDTHVSETQMKQITPDYTIKCKKGDFTCLEKELRSILGQIIHTPTISKYDSSGSIK